MEDHHRTPSTGGQASALSTNFPSISGTMVKVDYSFIDVEYRLGLSQVCNNLKKMMVVVCLTFNWVKFIVL